MNCLQISVPAHEISELFGGPLSRGLGLSAVLYLHMRIVLRGSLDGPHCHGS